MPDFRAHCPGPQTTPGELVLSPEESHHLVVVNRARAGDPVVAFDGKGREWQCALSEAAKKQARLRILAEQQATPLPFDLTLAQALPKGPSMDGIVRKATEIGTRVIIPLETERTQVHLDGGRSDKKIEKWQTAALEACKQCGNPWLPEIRPVQSLKEFLSTNETYDLKLVASLHPGAISLKQAVRRATESIGHSPRKAIWLIGPEGDFSPEEIETIVAHGFQPITLGPLVLRCETAATYALSILSHEILNT